MSDEDKPDLLQETEDAGDEAREYFEDDKE
jgi:hypothetical protein